MKKTNTKLLGLFVVGGIFLLVVGVLVFGSGRFFQTKVERVAFFPDSLAGLGEGAPVRFRGVKIGTVTKIVLDYNMKELKFTNPGFFRPRSQSICGIWRGIREKPLKGTEAMP